MESKKITLISELHVLKDDYTIKVAVIRMWNQMLFDNPNEKYSIEMILIDKQACVPRRCIPKFEKILKENVAFYMENSSLGMQVSLNKLVENENKLELQFKTKVTRCADFRDVIGYVFRCYDLEYYVGKNNKEMKKLNLKLEDLEGRILNVTLFNDYAQQMSDYATSKREEVVVIIVIQFGKASSFQEIHENKESNNNEIYPGELDVLLQRKFAFKIEISQYNLDKRTAAYTIYNLTEDSKIILELEKNYYIEQPLNSESFNVAMTDHASQETITMKDAVSYTGDNTTPMSEVQKNSARDICEENHLKRNLSSAFDVNDNSSMSSTKVRAIGMEDGTGKGHTKAFNSKVRKIITFRRLAHGQKNLTSSKALTYDASDKENLNTDKSYI
ncbi:hypothetical protein L1887_14400 [Cichorium endivia]|nr:hypothetical protein L1887_14400 [Cichorium endivia]